MYGYGEDIVPDIFQKVRHWGTRYPYPRNDQFDCVKKPRALRALFVENEYLKLTVLPELGGHVYSAYDKAAKREVFYRVSELKPSPLGQRGAWGPVGLEFNFPSSHAPSTLSRMDGVLRKNADGSASVVIGDIERVSRMRWCVEITLRPGRREIETVMTLHNRTSLSQGVGCWTNGAIPATHNIRWVVPTRATRGHGLPGGGTSWPITGGVDISWRRNIKTTIGVFARGSQEDFLGAYDVEHDWGVAHVADFRVMPGKKFFDWGTGPGGIRKSSEFSPPDGPYAEIQAGLAEEQPGTEMLGPYRAVRFTEFWVPLHGMKERFCRANAEGAVTLEPDGERGMQVAVNVVSRRPRSRIVLLRDGRKVYGTVRDLSPEKPFAVHLELDRKHVPGVVYEFSVLDAAEAIIAHRLEYGRKPARNVRGWLDEQSRPEESNGTEAEAGNGSAESLCMRGALAEKAGLWFDAHKSYERALEQDPGHAGAHLGLGVLALRSGEWRRAERHLNRVLARNPDLGEAYYYLGLAHAGAGRDDLAKDSFWRALREQAGDVRCRMELGRTAMRQKDFAAAAAGFSEALSASPHETGAMGLLAACLRQMGRSEEAVERIGAMLRRFPTDYLMRREAWEVEVALGRTAAAKREAAKLRDLLGANVEAYLELAADYAGCGLFEDAVAVLKMGIAVTGSPDYTYPLLFYSAGYCLEKLGRAGEAKRYYRRGGRMKPELCFPGRVEEIAVLERVLELYPHDTTAAVALGDILYQRVRREEAARLWRRAHRRMKRSLLLTSTLALASWDQGDLNGTLRWLRRAGRIDPDNMRLALWLDNVMIEAGQEKARFDLLEEAFGRRPEHDGVRERYASILLDRGRPGRAIELLSNFRFQTRHWIFTLSRLYVNTRTTLGERLLEKKEYGKALEEFEQACRVPVDLGEDETHFQFYGKAHYLAGVCLEKLGRRREALGCFRRCVEEQRPWLVELRYYDYLSYLKLGERKRAAKALQRLGAEVERTAKNPRAWVAYVHRLRSLYLLGTERRSEAKKEERLARRHGWRASSSLRFGIGF
jgi:tetratricopeptide (TPR) repeat protein